MPGLVSCPQAVSLSLPRCPVSCPVLRLSLCLSPDARSRVLSSDCLSVSPQMPGLVSCPGGLIVIGLLLLLCSSSVNTQSEIWTNEDVQYGRLGSNVTLLCRDALDRTSVEWRLNRSSVLPWQHRVTSDGRLVLVHAERAAEGNYSCHDEQGLLIQTTRLRLGYPPGLLSISCLVPNHSLVLCSWVESVKTHLPALYHTSYRGNKSQVRMCVVSSPPQQQCTITDPTMWQLYHYINVTETNPLGSQTTIIQVKFHELLQPDPPEAVTAVGMVGYPMRLQVYWTYPASWLHDAVPFPLRFQLRYRPVGFSTWSTVESKASTLLITDALAGHAHQLQVRAQDEINPDSRWSEWSPLLQTWPWSGCTADPTEQTGPVDGNDKDAELSTAKSESKSLFLSQNKTYLLFLYTSVSIYISLCIHQSLYTSVSVYISLCIHQSLYTSVSVYISLCIHQSVYISLCIHQSLYTSVSVYISLYIHQSLYTSVSIYISLCIHQSLYTSVSVYISLYIHQSLYTLPFKSLGSLRNVLVFER
uniref:Interleukin 11 receptor subunit alpha n=1 Tax=Salmo trutta TaxID=8032 RepID=A0A673ZB98_SALTR